MENEDKNEILKIEQNSFKTFFKEFIEETKQSTEKKIQTISLLLQSIKEETEQKITKGKYIIYYIQNIINYI
jgi:phage-related minor tail protein